MADENEDRYQEGYDDGYDNGYDSGYEEGLYVGQRDARTNDGELERIGSCGVDSGQLLLIDPCYIKKNWDDNYDNVEGDYRKICEVTFENGGGKTHNCGTAVSTGYGDGNYPVYVERRDGHIMKVVVDFSESVKD